MALHDTQKLNDYLGRRADEHLAFATTFGIDDVVQAVVLITKSVLEDEKRTKQTHKDGYADHVGFFFVGVEGKGLKNGEENISKDARAQNEYRATESASQTGFQRKPGLDGRCGIYLERGLADGGEERRKDNFKASLPLIP